MSELEKLLVFLPEKWRPLVSALIVASPFVTRAMYAIINGGGLKGIFTSIWLGTNTPKPKAAEPPASAPSLTDNYDPKKP